MLTPRSFTQDYHASLAYVAEDRQLLADYIGVPFHAVVKTASTTDRCGIDYLVSQPDGTQTSVDMKRRSIGACRLWQVSTIPELGIELEACPGKLGPLLSDRPLPDYWGLVYADLPDRLYMLPCETLRTATQANVERWAQQYPLVAHQTLRADGSAYASPTVYVPLPVVEAAMVSVLDTSAC